MMVWRWFAEPPVAPAVLVTRVVARSHVVARSPDRATSADRRSPQPCCGTVSGPCHFGRPQVSTASTRIHKLGETCGPAGGTVRRPCHNRGTVPQQGPETVPQQGDRAATGGHGPETVPERGLSGGSQNRP